MRRGVVRMDEMEAGVGGWWVGAVWARQEKDRSIIVS